MEIVGKETAKSWRAAHFAFFVDLDCLDAATSFSSIYEAGTQVVRS
jgi:hypothetical protein